MSADDQDVNEWAATILKAENRYCQDVTITSVHGSCPCGHHAGETFRVTALDAGGLCGSLYAAIFPSVVALHYGGAVLWEPKAGTFTGRCPEGGTVEVAVQRLDNPEPALYKKKGALRAMTVCGVPGLAGRRIVVEVIDIAGNCFYGHSTGDKIEIDPFQVNGMCGLLYHQLYPYMHVLLSGATPAWATVPHSITGECPDIYNRLSFRMSLEKRMEK
jgi:uncharacterized repeat protein (TIGR04076 family)